MIAAIIIILTIIYVLGLGFACYTLLHDPEHFRTNILGPPPHNFGLLMWVFAGIIVWPVALLIIYFTSEDYD